MEGGRGEGREAGGKEGTNKRMKKEYKAITFANKDKTTQISIIKGLAE